MLGQGNIVSQVSAEISLSLLKSPRVTMMSLHIICARDKKVLQFMTTITTSMVQHLKSPQGYLEGEGLSYAPGWTPPLTQRQLG